MYEAFGAKEDDSLKEAKRQAAMKMAKEKRAKAIGNIGKIAGGVIGGLTGGPAGAMKGASLGGAAGNILSGEGSVEDVMKVGTAVAGAMGPGEIDITKMSVQDINKMKPEDLMAAVKGKDLSKLSPEIRAAIMAFMARL